ncbi:MAG: ABC transporter substrate-binding protein [Pseudochelatococcus sp.]|jgi:branched-chain amino acid transport system substrate-binding protein|uniref:ABC transporter substrate-binding protein n=1 Tax=Pseudochelatococcus sp. TaxID=2020869 RepID=UPI003D8D5A4F
MRFFRLAASAAVVALCASEAAADYTIGALFPLSGTNATYGDIFMSGADMAASHINADGLLKEKVVMRYEDSQAMPQPAVVGMTKLVNVDKAQYVLSAFTGVSKAISTLATRNRVVAINGGGVGPDLAKLGDYFWNVIPLANFEIRALVPHLVGEGGKRWALVYVDDPLGASAKEELATQLPKSGGEFVDSFAVPTTAQQFAGIAAKVRAANVDVVYIASYGSQQIQIVKQLRENGVNAQFASYSGMGVPDVMALPQAEGLLYTSQAIDFESDDPVSKRFISDFKQKYDRLPSSYTVNYYNSVRLFGLLAKHLEENGKPVTGENLLAARREIGAFNLVGGSVRFEENGTLLAPIQVNRIAKGSSEVVKTFDLAE